jgi:hypothetical protein
LAYGDNIKEALSRSNNSWDTLAVLAVLIDIQKEQNHNFDQIRSGFFNSFNAQNVHFNLHRVVEVQLIDDNIFFQLQRLDIPGSFLFFSLLKGLPNG